MITKEKICTAQKRTDWAKSVRSRAAQFPSWFGKSPASVLIDFSISSDAKVLLGVLALKTYKTHAKCNTVDFSIREVAELFGKSASTISAWLKQLVEAGHVEKLSGRKSRTVCKLLSPAFDYRVRVETAPAVVAEVSASQVQGLREKKARCPKCKAMARIKSTSGVCAGCLDAWASRTA